MKNKYFIFDIDELNLDQTQVMLTAFRRIDVLRLAFPQAKFIVIAKDKKVNIDTELDIRKKYNLFDNIMFINVMNTEKLKTFIPIIRNVSDLKDKTEEFEISYELSQTIGNYEKGSNKGNYGDIKAILIDYLTNNQKNDFVLFAENLLFADPRAEIKKPNLTKIFSPYNTPFKFDDWKKSPYKARAYFFPFENPTFIVNFNSKEQLIEQTLRNGNLNKYINIPNTFKKIVRNLSMDVEKVLTAQVTKHDIHRIEDVIKSVKNWKNKTSTLTVLVAKEFMPKLKELITIEFLDQRVNLVDINEYKPELLSDIHIYIALTLCSSIPIIDSDAFANNLKIVSFMRKYSIIDANISPNNITIIENGKPEGIALKIDEAFKSNIKLVNSETTAYISEDLGKKIYANLLDSKINLTSKFDKEKIKNYLSKLVYNNMTGKFSSINTVIKPYLSFREYSGIGNEFSVKRIGDILDDTKNTTLIFDDKVIFVEQKIKFINEAEMISEATISKFSQKKNTETKVDSDAINDSNQTNKVKNEIIDAANGKKANINIMNRLNNNNTNSLSSFLNIDFTGIVPNNNFKNDIKILINNKVIASFVDSTKSRRLVLKNIYLGEYLYGSNIDIITNFEQSHAIVSSSDKATKSDDQMSYNQLNKIIEYASQENSDIKVRFKLLGDTATYNKVVINFSKSKEIWENVAKVDLFESFHSDLAKNKVLIVSLLDDNFASGGYGVLNDSFVNNSKEFINTISVLVYNLLKNRGLSNNDLVFTAGNKQAYGVYNQIDRFKNSKIVLIDPASTYAEELFHVKENLVDISEVTSRNSNNITILHTNGLIREDLRKHTDIKFKLIELDKIYESIVAEIID